MQARQRSAQDFKKKSTAYQSGGGGGSILAGASALSSMLAYSLMRSTYVIFVSVWGNNNNVRLPNVYFIQTRKQYSTQRKEKNRNREGREDGNRRPFFSIVENKAFSTCEQQSDHAISPSPAVGQ
jgi:hypothetical protein